MRPFSGFWPARGGQSDGVLVAYLAGATCTVLVDRQDQAGQQAAGMRIAVVEDRRGTAIGRVAGLIGVQ